MMNEQIRFQFEEMQGPEARSKNPMDLIPVGRENSISMTMLSHITEVTPREIRRKIHNARISGKVICGDSSGYYYPQTKEELLRYVMKERKSGSSKYEALRSAETALQKMIDAGEFSEK